MVPNIFGTDGVRGLANTYPMTAETILRLGQAVGRQFESKRCPSRAVIGKDTRLSGYMVESALVAGLTSVGMNVELTGPLPTPAIAMLTRTLRADLGVMISASHNPYHDNGIKFFGPDGFKLSDAEEHAIARSYAAGGALVPPARIGRAKRLDGSAERYIEFAKRSLPRDIRLNGLKIVIDAANGAAFRTAPTAIWELGAEVVQIGTDPSGVNINDASGSTSPAACRKAVLEHGADLGIALDGDADRLLVIDEKGNIVDGDQVMALIAESALAQGKLRQATLVATVMSNAGLDRHLAGCGIGVVRTAVGDRYVVEKMRELGCSLGGEQSGHIILSDFTTTGDGLIAALQVLACLVGAGRPASETLRRFRPLPQVQRTVRLDGGLCSVDAPVVQEAIARGKAQLGSDARILVRPSGTEPVIRVMTEGEDISRLEQVAEDICTAIAKARSDPGVREIWDEDAVADCLPLMADDGRQRRHRVAVQANHRALVA